MSFYKFVGKRAFDLVAAAGALVLLSPLLAIIAATVAAKLGRPVLFFQTRSGKGGRPFRMVKFRSMLDARTGQGGTIDDAERLTPFGKRLRASSLDELPGLWNILQGDVSLVGPRPLHVHYDRLYNPRQARRLEVRPGLTGWAQINGRNAVGWPAKLELDVWYVENQSFWLDLKIILGTIPSVLKREGINSAEAATMPAFTGEVEPGHVRSEHRRL